MQVRDATPPGPGGVTLFDSTAPIHPASIVCDAAATPGAAGHCLLCPPAVTLSRSIPAHRHWLGVVSTASAAFEAEGRAAQEAAAAAMAFGPAANPPKGFVKVGPGRAVHTAVRSGHAVPAAVTAAAAAAAGRKQHLLYAEDDSRYFMLGGDYFRGMFNRCGALPFV